MKKHLFKKVTVTLFCVLTLMTVFMLASCDNKAIGNDAECISFTDALGRELSVRKQPKRVAKSEAKRS